MKQKMTLKKLFRATKEFCQEESKRDFPELLGITDGKAVGTFVEHRLKEYLLERYETIIGNSATGIDLPAEDINTDIKVTSIRQPQSSCPYKSSEQKIFGLGYNLLVLIYDKKDDEKASRLNFLNCTFVSEEKTADYTTTKRLMEMLNDGAIKEDIIAYFLDRNIPGDEILLDRIADKVMQGNLEQGYLTISNALQWRLQYKRVISLENEVQGVLNYDVNKR